MKLGKITNKNLYWALIITFALLYLCVGFVSTLHSITFFNITNSIALAVLLGLTYEIGQASVLFSILLTKNKDKFLPWSLMFLLTALQITANVYASFKFMANSGSTDWTYWYKSILIGVQSSNPETYQIIISWISGALLPVVALGMTALVAENIKMASDENEEEDKNQKEDIITDKSKEITLSREPIIFYDKKDSSTKDEYFEKIKEEYNKLTEEDKKINIFPNLNITTPKHTFPTESSVIKDPIIIDLNPIKLSEESIDKNISSTIDKIDTILDNEEIKENQPDKTIAIDNEEKEPLSVITEKPKKPINNVRGWHLQKEYIDSNGDVYRFGEYQPNEILPLAPELAITSPEEIDTSKKA